MASAKDLFSYTKVEGVYLSWVGWWRVALCSDCLRVVAILTDDGQKWKRSPGQLCEFCGHILCTRTEEGVTWGGLLYARARVHHDICWWNPSTWRTGHWEVRDFEELQQERVTPDRERVTPARSSPEV